MAYKNLTGETYGYWTVLEDAHESTSDRDHYWICKCQCGTIRKVRGGSLKKGQSKSCGCQRKSINLIGQKFGRLTVLQKTNERNSSGGILWLCKCDCGNICKRPTSTLKKEGIHSCGCYNIEKIIAVNQKDLVNKKFGKLTVLQKTNERNSFGGVLWLCKCDCGNVVKVETHSLTSGNTTSCGCINYSIGEKNIEKILKENNLIFQSQYTTKELHKKRFDFAIFNSNQKLLRLIEFDGIQHYNDTHGMWNSKESLQDIQERDKIKDEWAKNNNIPLVRIPYWERDNITLEMIMGDKYLVK